MAKVTIRYDQATREAETLDSLIRRWKKSVMNDDTINEFKKHEVFRSKRIKAKEKHEAAVARLKRAQKKSKKFYNNSNR